MNMLAKRTRRALLRASVLFCGLASFAVAAETASDPVVGGSYTIKPATANAPHPGRSGPLTEQERTMATIAWRYFQNNTQAETGLVNSVDNFPSTTLWDIGSSIGAIISAKEIGLIAEDEATQRIGRMLDTLARIELFRGLCPNKAYNSATGERVTYSGQPGEIGCSALDVGRLLVWMRVIEQRYPALKPKVLAAVGHWNLASMVRGGDLYGTAIGPDGQTQFLQEGRLGYEEYGAKAFRLWGFDTRKAAAPDPYGLISIFGVRLPYDARDPKVYGAHNYVVTESYALDGIEFGWDEPGDIQSGPFEFSSGWIARSAQRVYEAQEERHARTGILTARTEHQLAGAPYFVYDTIFSDGIPWATITDTGAQHPEFASVALKGALGLWALWKTPYTEKLFDHISTAYDPKRGFYEGLLESSGEKIDTFTANNNGIMLESLLYKLQGPILKPQELPALPFTTAAPASARHFRSDNQSAMPVPSPDQPGGRQATGPALTAATTLAAKPSDASSTTAPRGQGLPPADASPLMAGSAWSAPASPGAPHPGRSGPLSDAEMALAKAAWTYIRTNTQPGTGLVDAVERYPSSTLWDTTSALAGIVSAQQLSLIDKPEAEDRISAMLASLRKIRLFRGMCPNKAFNTITLKPTNYGNVPKEIGCSAIDVGRALTWLRVIERLYPDQQSAVSSLVDYWNVAGLVREGELVGTGIEKGKVVHHQEGRLGYEEYAAKGYALWGHKVERALDHAPSAIANIEDVAIAHDARDMTNSGGNNYVLTETAMLDGIEFGWDRPDDTTSGPFEFSDGWGAAQAWHIYLAQERRSLRTGILTARSEHQVMEAPHFVYGSVFANGTPWATIDIRGKQVPAASALATKAALGMWALWPSDYTDRLFAAIARHMDPTRGIFEGLLESGGSLDGLTANTNGIVLETLLYKVKGPILRQLGMGR